ncbi:glycosyltransferase [Magnetococcus sp. PR-3]|uniref:glycosyltransferase n=1 Tax=Magnetococcus sp. PR-3 TaxID=3120355 RepID=UPI002FCE2AB7
MGTPSNLVSKGWRAMLRAENMTDTLPGVASMAPPLREPVALSNIFGTQYDKKVALVYITMPFANKNIPPCHPSLETCTTMARILSLKGYNVDVIHYLAVKAPDINGYDLIVGFGYPFEKSFNKPFAGKRIYFATETTTFQRNGSEMERLRQLRRRQGVAYPPHRLKPFPDYASILHSDAIFCTGNQWTMDTYRALCDVPIYRTQTHSYAFFREPDLSRDWHQAKDHFLFIGGAGMILKGLDLAIETFLRNPQWSLHVCTPPIDPTFKAIYGEALEQAPNIHFHGFLDLSTDAFKQQLAQCGFVFFPSASEAGGTSCLDAMVGGLIPIVTQEASVNVEPFGFTLPGVEIAQIEATLHHALQQSEADLKLRSEASYLAVRNNHLIEHFIQAFSGALDAVLSS